MMVYDMMIIISYNKRTISNIYLTTDQFTLILII